MKDLTIIPMISSFYGVDDNSLHSLLSTCQAAGLSEIIVSSRDVSFVRSNADSKTMWLNATISYPSGAGTEISRRYEAEEAGANGADGLCVVFPVGRFRDGDDDFCCRQLSVFSGQSKPTGRYLMIESCLLDDQKITNLVDILGSSTPHLVPSTGFLGADASPDLPHEARRLKSLAGELMVVPLSSGKIDELNALIAAGFETIIVMAEDGDALQRILKLGKTLRNENGGEK